LSAAAKLPTYGFRCTNRRPHLGSDGAGPDDRWPEQRRSWRTWHGQLRDEHDR